jgi:hypothetical protein
VDLDELAPVGGRATGGRDKRRFERFAQMREDLPDRPRLGCNAMSRMSPPHPRALQRKLLAHPGHELGPSDPGSVVRARFVARVAAATGGISARRMSVDRMLIGRSIPQLATVPDSERRDGGPELVIRGEHPWLVSSRQAVPVLPRGNCSTAGWSSCHAQNRTSDVLLKGLLFPVQACSFRYVGVAQFRLADLAIS